MSEHDATDKKLAPQQWYRNHTPHKERQLADDMNKRSPKHKTQAFTKVELLVLLVISGVLASLLALALGKAKERAQRIQCIDNLRQTSTGFRLFSADGSPDYPFASLSKGTAVPAGLPRFDSKSPGELWKLFQSASMDLSSPRVLVCPADPGRISADSFGTNGLSTEFAHTGQRLNALSYFASIDANEQYLENIHMGDRYLTRDPEAKTEATTTFLSGQNDVGYGSTSLTELRWITTIHGGGGNAIFMDGSAYFLTSAKLRTALRKQGTATNRIWLPNTDATGRGNP